jgi:hypothetical protein
LSNVFKSTNTLEFWRESDPKASLRVNIAEIAHLFKKLDYDTGKNINTKIHSRNRIFNVTIS